jgi:hypothetical protein
MRGVMEIHLMSMAALNLPRWPTPAASGRHATCCRKKKGPISSLGSILAIEKYWALRGSFALLPACARRPCSSRRLRPAARWRGTGGRPHCMRPHCIIPTPLQSLYYPLPTLTPRLLIHTHVLVLGHPHTVKYSDLPRVISPGTVVISLSSPRISTTSDQAAPKPLRSRCPPPPPLVTACALPSRVLYPLRVLPHFARLLLSTLLVSDRGWARVRVIRARARARGSGPEP